MPAKRDRFAAYLMQLAAQISVATFTDGTFEDPQPIFDIFDDRFHAGGKVFG
jgi:hypothetical protein